MIKQIAHAAFIVSDMKQSLEFYVDKLGFEKAFEMKDKENNPWIIYIKINENQFIELFYPTEIENMNQPKIGYNHLCLEVTNINELEAALSKKGVPIDVPVLMGEDHNYQFWTHDPDGNPIEFMEYGLHSLQKKI